MLMVSADNTFSQNIFRPKAEKTFCCFLFLCVKFRYFMSQVAVCLCRPTKYAAGARFNKKRKKKKKRPLSLSDGNCMVVTGTLVPSGYNIPQHLIQPSSLGYSITLDHYSLIHVMIKK